MVFTAHAPFNENLHFRVDGGHAKKNDGLSNDGERSSLQLQQGIFDSSDCGPKV